MRFVCHSHLQYKILLNFTRNDFNCFLASSKGHHQLDSYLRCGIFIRTDDGVRQPTHGDTNLYYLWLFQSWQKQLPIQSQQKQLGRRRQRFEVSQNKKKERGIIVTTGASDVVSEVHYPNKSNSVMQQNANKNVKRNDNNNTKSHPNTKKTCAERHNFHTSSISTKFPQRVEQEKR
jgi:hypothetical protein